MRAANKPSSLAEGKSLVRSPCLTQKGRMDRVEPQLVGRRALERHGRLAVNAPEDGSHRGTEVFDPDVAAHALGSVVADEQLPRIDDGLLVIEEMPQEPCSLNPGGPFEAVLLVEVSLQPRRLQTNAVRAAPDGLLRSPAPAERTWRRAGPPPTRGARLQSPTRRKPSPFVRALPGCARWGCAVAAATSPNAGPCSRAG